MKRLTLVALVTTAFVTPALAADDIQIIDPYARASSPVAQSGAAFMGIANHGDQDTRVIGARSDVAARVELHTHIEDADGIMRMVEVEEGFPLPAGSIHVLERGGDHLMFMGLTRPLAQGDDIAVTLEFDNGAMLDIIVPVDLERLPAHGHTHDHGHAHD